MTDELLIQRVSSALDMWPETAENDTALVFRVAALYHASFGMSAEESLLLPSIYAIKQAKKRIVEGTHK